MGLAAAVTSEQLFAHAPGNSVPGIESTPFYLYDARRPSPARRGAARCEVHRHPSATPIDRAYSNWMHLWVDGLEPIAATSSRPCDRERERDRWPDGRLFWHYRRMGRYGRAGWADLFKPGRPGRAGLGDALSRAGRPTPGATLDRVCRFLGLAEGPYRHGAAGQLPPVRREPGLRTGAVLGRMIRVGACGG